MYKHVVKNESLAYTSTKEADSVYVETGREQRMISLEKSGLPLYLNEKNHVMALSALLEYESYKRKYVEDMKGLLEDEKKLNPKEPFYDVYRGIDYPHDRERFRTYEIRYDVTVIMPGTVNGECKKTSGHYHGWNPQKTTTYAEVYEVLLGTALYVLQKSRNIGATGQVSDTVVDDLILVIVHAGQTLIVPPGYGHASVNVGDGPMVFSNLAYIPCPVLYDTVRYFHGMGCYVNKDAEGLHLKRNENYAGLPRVKYATVREDAELGIRFGVPVYKSFQKQPELFRFLAQPEQYSDEVMSLLDYHDSLSEAIGKGGIS